MDNFAQTREADDLFAAEVSPPQSTPPSAPTEPRAFPSKGGSGNRGGGGGSGGRGGHQPRSVDQRNQPKETKIVEGAPEGPAAESKDAPRQQKQDRTLSGGLKKTKLTEEQLTERMARAKLNNERLVERRRKVEEDENSFQAQEEARKQADATKRTVERKKKGEQERGRKELDDERAKNRQRKLNAVNSREWDSTKTEEDYNPRKGSSQYRRGAHGGVADSTRGPPGSRGPPGGGFRGAPSGPRGSSGSFRGAPSGPRGASGSNRGAAASRGAPRNPNTTQEWPALPTAPDKASADTPTQAEATPKPATPTNDQPASFEDQPSTDKETPAGGGMPTGSEAPAENNASLEVETPEESPAIGGLDTKYNAGDNLTPLSPAVGGDSWAEQVESAS